MVARRTFFSFHFERDIWRASQVRNSWVTKDRESAGFWDAAAWEEVKKKGEDAVHRWIDDQLRNTSVTVVLIGAETADRPYVGYEIQQSYDKGNGILGIYIHSMKDASGEMDTQGRNALSNWQVEKDGRKTLLSGIYPSYDWINDKGRENMGDWIEAAAKKAGR
jgi:hypothetical protein